MSGDESVVPWRDVGWTRPRFASPVSSESVEMAKTLGVLMPVWGIDEPWGWQQQFWALVLDRVGGEPRYKTVVVTITRQTGKTVALYPLMWWWLETGQRVLFTLHQRLAGAEKWDQIATALMAVQPEKYRIRRRLGAQRLTHRGTGGFLALVTPDDAGGRSETGDVIVIDEAAHISPMFLPAARAAKLTRVDAQVVMISSGITDQSIDMSISRERAIAELPYAERTAGILEWSASEGPGAAGLDLGDEALWARWIPTLGAVGGARIEAVREAFRDDSAEVFAREYLSVPSASSISPPISTAMWSGCSIESGPERDEMHSVVLGVDVGPQQAWGAIVAVGWMRDGSGLVAELCAHGEGDAWLLDDICLAARRLRPVEIVADQRSPAAAVAPSLQLRGWMMRLGGATDMARACARTFTSLTSGAVRVVQDDALTVAALGAVRRVIADVGWAWDRRPDSGLDISPLVALSLGVESASHYAVTAEMAD